MTGLRAALLVPGLALAILASFCGVIWADFDPGERRAVADLLTPPRIGLIVLLVLVLAGAVGLITFWLVAPGVRAARRIAEGMRLVAHANPAHRLPLAAPVELQAVARAANELADERSKLLLDFEAAAADATARVEEERNRLAALVSELDQSVLVCNREGRVLLYNASAVALIGAPAEASELLGLGRSVFGIIDRAVILHAVEAMERQVERDARQSTHFVTATQDGRLLRVQAAPVASATGESGTERVLTGYVLLLADITAPAAADAKRAALFQELVEASRAALANIRAAIENLTAHPEMNAARRGQFTTIIQDEAVRLSDRLHRVTAELAEGLKVGWLLEDMRAEDLLTLARSRIERRTGLMTKLEAIDPALWLRVDSFSLAQGLSYVAGRLQDEFSVREVRFRLGEAGGHAQLDILWRGPPMSSETAFAWQSEPFTQGGEDSPLTLAQVLERHGGEVWYQFDVATQMAYFRLLLPVAASHAGARPRSVLPSRPEFYDFDLFSRSPVTDAQDEQALAALSFTVFDTETTGLDPAGGDEIIAIGGVRIVNGRLLQGETFDCLVDPQRSLPQASVAVHGITREMLVGQPTIEQVLPRFRRFAEETVLVGHNAAFDMRFLQKSEARTGVRFEQAVLDTLFLSAVVHPAHASHSLEEIATRLGVVVVGRHTALGDALVTAEIFLRLIPLLAERGIRTLGEARAASQKTYYARLKY
jgi:DNA polymerase-3 subunit epsilon